MGKLEAPSCLIRSETKKRALEMEECQSSIAMGVISTRCGRSMVLQVLADIAPQVTDSKHFSTTQSPSPSSSITVRKHSFRRAFAF